MRHLLSFTVYQEPAELQGYIDGIRDSGCDGIELLTGYEQPPDFFKDHTVTVHLPYATDWLAGWEGRPYDIDEDSVRYFMYGRDREEVLDSLVTAFGIAGTFDPEHAVFHACNADIPELHSRRYTRPDVYVIDALCEMVNTAVSMMPHGRLPFTLALENLWWPGLRLLGPSGFRRLQDRLEFDDWCLCLDTGHMMGCLPGIHTEEDGIDGLLKVFDGYPSDMVDRITALHFHYSATSTYRDTFEERSLGDGADVMEFVNSAYPHVSRIDVHLPFSSSRCNEILDVLQPSIVVHELPGSGVDVVSDYRLQRSLIP